MDYPHAAHLQHRMDPPVSTGTSTVYPFGFADGCVALVQLLVLATKLRLELVAICEDWSLEIEAPWFAPELEMNPQGKDLLHFELVTCFRFSIFDFMSSNNRKSN